MDVIVDVQYACKESHLPSKFLLRRWVKTTLSTVNWVGKTELTIRMVTEAEGKALNEIWRLGLGPTNVLSFPFECLPNINRPLLGDVVICAAIVAREAREQHKPVRAHWAHMVVHGVLHLLYYDHCDDIQAQAMEAMEIAVLQSLGYPSPYTAIETA